MQIFRSLIIISLLIQQLISAHFLFLIMSNYNHGAWCLVGSWL